MKFSLDEDDRTDVSLTPLIDVVFLLLIFFMVTTTFNQHANLRVELPDASNAVQSNEDNKVEVIIDKNGQYFIDGTSLLDQQARTLVTALGKVVKDRKTEKILIRADAQAPHQIRCVCYGCRRQTWIDSNIDRDIQWAKLQQQLIPANNIRPAYLFIFD